MVCRAEGYQIEENCVRLTNFQAHFHLKVYITIEAYLLYLQVGVKCIYKQHINAFTTCGNGYVNNYVEAKHCSKQIKA